VVKDVCDASQKNLNEQKFLVVAEKKVVTKRFVRVGVTSFGRM